MDEAGVGTEELASSGTAELVLAMLEDIALAAAGTTALASASIGVEIVGAGDARPVGTVTVVVEKTSTVEVGSDATSDTTGGAPQTLASSKFPESSLVESTTLSDTWIGMLSSEFQSRPSVVTELSAGSKVCFRSETST